MGAVVDYRTLIVQAANRYGVPPEIALAVAQQESGIQQFVNGQVLRGKAGEYGIFQLMPGTANDLGVDPTDARQNIEGGVRYLSQMYSMTGGNWTEALAAYNGGIGNWQRNTVSSDARAYASSVMGRVPFQMGQEPGQVTTTLPALPTLANSWSGAWSPDIVYGSGAVYSSDVVGDASSRLGWLVLAAAAAAVIIIGS